jgi:hypothetical protein
MPGKSINSRKGFLLAEAVVGMVVLACIMGGTIVAFRAQVRAAERTLNRTRCRLVLEGELDIMRGLPASEIQPCTGQAFQPTLGTPKAMDELEFRRTVRRREDGRLAEVRLQVMKKRGEKPVEWMSLESAIFILGAKR